MADSVEGTKLWCQVFVENKATFAGYTAERFSAIAYAIGDSSLTFSLPAGTRKIFNWGKVLWFMAEEIVEDEPQEQA